jgi:hypothetical protein
MAFTFRSLDRRAGNHEGRTVGEDRTGNDAENDYRTIFRGRECSRTVKQLRSIIVDTRRKGTGSQIRVPQLSRMQSSLDVNIEVQDAWRRAPADDGSDYALVHDP